jgi:hypothetical protein
LADGQIAIFTGGRFLWPAVRNANPAFVFDPVSINTLKAKNITFEPVFSGSGNNWIGLLKGRRFNVPPPL